VIKVVTSVSVARMHLFKIMHHALSMSDNSDLRENLWRAKNSMEMKVMVAELDSRLPKLESDRVKTPNFVNKVMLLPYFVCKPYLRPSQPCFCEHEFDEILGISKTPDLKINTDPENLKQICEKCAKCGGGIFSFVNEVEFDEFESRMKQEKVKLEENSSKLSGKDRKRLRMQEKLDKKKLDVKCGCGNQKSDKCVHVLCKSCCEKKSIEISGDCKTHKFKFETVQNPEKRPKLQILSIS